MKTEEHESNWARACRALGFDWPAVMMMNADVSAGEGSGRRDGSVSSTSHDADVIAAFRSAQVSANET